MTHSQTFFYQEPKKVFQSSSKTTSFAQQQVQLNDSMLFFPAGYENIFLALYAILLPYITGILFLVIFIAKGDLSIFTALNDEAMFFYCWCIGYECLASIALLLIIKSAIMFHMKNSKSEYKKFQRP
jgi:cellulose synthase/poly-beta-1,6-N-acetylglucosamine synthase-like glycosyltransferase